MHIEVVCVASIVSYETRRFLRECKAAGKKVYVWTINEPRKMMEVSLVL